MLVCVRWVLVVVVAGLLLTGCGSGHSASRSGANAVGSVIGCGATRLHRGTVPSWTAAAWSSGSPAARPFAITRHGTAAAFLFGYPLRAGAPSSPSNKILWVMRLPRNGSQLVIRATPEHSLSPTITVTESADSGPGEIYPSIVNVPRSGCWHLQVRWAGHSDSVNLRYHAREQE